MTVVDVVTPRQFNLYADLMAFVGHPDPAMSADPPHLYAASCRWLREPRAAASVALKPEVDSRSRRCRCGWPKRSSCRSTWSEATSRPATTCGSRDRRRPSTSVRTGHRLSFSAL
ncbi:MAG: hypothetical protein U0797_22600 [Gemmataceae bacterium]